MNTKLFIHTVDATGVMRINDIKTGRQCWTFDLQKFWPTETAQFTVDTHPAGHFLVSEYHPPFSANKPNTWCTVDLKKNRRPIKFNVNLPLLGMIKMSEQGTYVVGIVRGSPGGKVAIWKLPADWTKESLEATLVAEVAHGSYVTSVCVDEFSKRLYTAGGDLIHAWGLEDGKPLHCFEGHDLEIKSIDVVAPPLVLGSSDGITLKLWRTDIGAEFYSRDMTSFIGAANKGAVVPMHYVNRKLFLSDKSGNIYSINMTTKEIAVAQGGKLNGSVFNFMVDPVNDLMVTVDVNAIARTYKMSNGKVVAEKAIVENTLICSGGLFSNSNAMREKNGNA